LIPEFTCVVWEQGTGNTGRKTELIPNASYQKSNIIPISN